MSAEQHPNAARIANFYATLDESTTPEEAHAMMVEAFAEDAVWHHLGDCHHAKTYHGRDAIITDLMASMVTDSGGTWKPAAVDIQALGDELVTVHMVEGAEIGGEYHEGHVAVTFKLVDGKIVEGVRMMDSDLDAHWATAAA